MQATSMHTTTKPISRNAADGGFRHASATPITSGEPTLAGSRDLPELLPAAGTPNGVLNAHRPSAGWEESVAYSGAPVEQRATVSARELGEPKERLDALPLVPGGDALADHQGLSGESMRRFFACVLGALAAVIFCAATVTAASALGMQPRYPAYAGEDDFSLRVAWFILLELPGFVVLGGWLGDVAAGRVRRGVLGAAGMIAGTVIAFLVQSALGPTIESLPNATSANVAVVVFLVAWLVLAGGGAALGVLRAGKPTGGRLMRTGLLVVTLAVSGGGCAKASDSQSDAKRKFVPAGWTVEQELRGDLNGDGISDAVLMLVEEGHAGPTDEAGRYLVVLAGQRDGSFVEMGTSRKLLLCVQCVGAMGGKPRLSIQRNVLVVEQETGSRETTSGLWRFRFDSESKRMRLIGLDVKKTDRDTGVSTSESTNYLNDKRVTESLRYDKAKDKDVVVSKKAGSVDSARIFLEDADASPLD